MKKIIPKLPIFIFFILVFVFFIRPVAGDGDFFHHLNTGKYVWQHHRLPYTDEFTFTAYGKEWIAHSWGAGLIFYLLYENFGPISISLLVAGIALITFILLYLILRSYFIPPLFSLLTLSLAVAPFSIRFPNRPEIFTYPLLLALFLIERLKKTLPKLVFFYPLIILLWANLYGSSVIFGLVFLLFLIFKQFWQDGFKIALSRKKFYLFSLLSLPVSLFNGYGVKTLFYIFLITKVSQFQGEWGGIFKIMSVSPLPYLLVFQYKILIYLLYLGIFILVFFLSRKNIKTIPFLTYLFPLIFIPLVIFRHVPLATLLTVPIFGVLLLQVFPSRRFVLVVLTFFISVFSLVLTFWIEKPGIGENFDFSSSSLAAFLKKSNLSGRAFNNQEIGGWLGYYFNPMILVFTDTRDDLFLGTSVLDDYFNIFLRNKNVLPLLEKYKVDLVIGDLAEGISYHPLFISEGWAPVFIDDHYFVAVPKKVAEAKKLPILDAVDPYLASGAKTGMGEKALSQYREQYVQGKSSFNNQMQLAYLNFYLGRYKEVLDIALKIEIGEGPEKYLLAESKDYLLANTYLSLGNCPLSKQFLDKTEEDIKGRFIFSPRKLLPSSVNKGYAFYYLLCEKNTSRGRLFLEKFLNQPEVSGEEKREARQQFNRE